MVPNCKSCKLSPKCQLFSGWLHFEGQSQAWFCCVPSGEARRPSDTCKPMSAILRVLTSLLLHMHSAFKRRTFTSWSTIGYLDIKKLQSQALAVGQLRKVVELCRTRSKQCHEVWIIACSVTDKAETANHKIMASPGSFCLLLPRTSSSETTSGVRCWESVFALRCRFTTRRIISLHPTDGTPNYLAFTSAREDTTLGPLDSS